MCDYHNASYAVRILDGYGNVIDKKEDFYDKNGPENVEVELRAGMERNKQYTAIINVTTAVKSTTTKFAFGEYNNQ